MRSSRWISGLLVAGFAAVCAPAVSAQSAISPRFGTTSIVQQHIGFPEFSPASSSTSYQQTSSSVQTGIYATGSGLFTAIVHIPTGAKLMSFELDYCDFDPTSHVTLILSECDFMGGGCTTMDSITTSTLGGTGCGFLAHDLSSLNYTMENNFRELLLSAILSSGSASNILNGAYVAYQLQVSPAPATATFLDVPTTSPLFKFVEALVAAGITAGCGGGNFCPGASITRGQMAVFLASALGLHFPD